MGSISQVEDLTTVLDIPTHLQSSLLQDRVSGHRPVPRLHLNTVKYRQTPTPAEKIEFRVRLLRTLRQRWTNDQTEAKFLEAVNIIETDGVGLFGGLIDPSLFEQFVAEYGKLQSQQGNKSFMHSYVNLAYQLEFLTGGKYIDSFAHPLLIALISYLMGGPVRIMDLRGKDTEPISINAQDNMLHIDNTPFKEEYKVLLNWQRGQAKGPSGQNFTFLPWTHKGNRDILLDESGLPWSTERDSLFTSNEAIDGLFEFQKETKGVSRVVEARYPDQPLACIFPAGSLVHHRHRTAGGNSRSCVIAAFHVTGKHPGRLMEVPPIIGRKKTLIEFLVSHQDEHSDEEFLDILLEESRRIETKIQEIFQPSHPSTLIDLEPLALSGDRLAYWRDDVVKAPNPLMIRLNRNIRLSGTDFGDLEALTETLGTVMDYDKHGLLQLILYEDGREEIRKPSRKVVGEMKRDVIVGRLRPWINEVLSSTFSLSDLTEPKTLRVMCDMISGLAKNAAEDVKADTEAERKTLRLAITSLSRLMMDLGEAITRCEGVETFLSTSLFLFWTADEICKYLDEATRAAIRSILVLFLRNYVASVLLIESVHS